MERKRGLDSRKSNAVKGRADFLPPKKPDDADFEALLGDGDPAPSTEFADEEKADLSISCDAFILNSSKAPPGPANGIKAHPLNILNGIKWLLEPLEISLGDKANLVFRVQAQTFARYIHNHGNQRITVLNFKAIHEHSR
jgi:hypothetical protein